MFSFVKLPDLGREDIRNIQNIYQDKNLTFRFMKNRDPYDIKGFIIAYNLFQTLLSLWGFREGWK